MEKIMTYFGNEVTLLKHSSGLGIMHCENRELSKAYAVYATNFGSVINHFKMGDEQFRLPDGTAHFLEHKLFENEEGDAFAKFGKVGGNANAFTDFDITAYLFSCTSQFKENLEILLDFVARPYFTEKSVAKEQGIIGQEITMYNDDPDWRVTFNLLRALYKNNPVKNDIAGDIHSISTITPELLYTTYQAFYRPSNMVLSVCGNVGLSEVLEVVDRFVKPEKTEKIVVPFYQPDTDSSVEKRVVQHLMVAKPLFAIGYKDVHFEHGKALALREVEMEILLNCIVGKGSKLYNKLYDEGLISGSFGAAYVCSDTFAHTVFEGESSNPDAVFERIKAEIDRLREVGIERADFERSKKLVYGRLLAEVNTPENTANMMARSLFLCQNVNDRFIAATKADFEHIPALIYNLEDKVSAISIILPQD